MGKPSFIAAEAAAELLAVEVATLYSYVSRGLLRSEPVPGSPRQRRYRRDDVERLRERRESRRHPEQVAPKALSWGEAVLESSLTLVDAGRLYYRGFDVVELASSWRLEEVAALLWTGDPGAAGELFAAQPGPERLPPELFPVLASLDPVERCQVALPLAGAADLAAADLRPRSLPPTAARILRLLFDVAAQGEHRPGLAATLAAAWRPKHPGAERAIEAALVLSADHELNVSTFAARCAASAAASPYDVVSAGLATLKGGRHGGFTARVEVFLREVGEPGRARQAIGERLRRAEPVPGFGHPLYPEGDPRAETLLALAAAAGNPEPGLAAAVAGAAWELLNERPNLDFGLVALTHAYELPRAAPLTLFALGRSIGWLAHAIEQAASDKLIRPRARYTGEPPRPGDRQVAPTKMIRSFPA